MLWNVFKQPLPLVFTDTEGWMKNILIPNLNPITKIKASWCFSTERTDSHLHHGRLKIAWRPAAVTIRLCLCVCFFLKILVWILRRQKYKTPTAGPHAAGPFITGFTAEEQVNMEAKVSVHRSSLSTEGETWSCDSSWRQIFNHLSEESLTKVHKMLNINHPTR